MEGRVARCQTALDVIMENLVALVLQIRICCGRVQMQNNDVKLISPREVLIKAIKITESKIPNEWIALIGTAKGNVSLFTSTENIDRERYAVRALVIGMVGSHLIVDLPDSPIGTAPKVRVPEDSVLKI